MATMSFQNLLIHLVFDEIASGAWMAVATIEDPATAETSPVALPDVHRSQRAAGLQIVREARMRILRGTWRN